MKNLYIFCAIICSLLSVYANIKNIDGIYELIIIALLFVILSEIKKENK